MELSHLSGEEFEFEAEDTLVRILPNFRAASLSFFSGEYGPFEPMEYIEVPLWLAIVLKKKKKCDIIMPEWLTLNKLKEILAEEKENDFYTDLPFHYREIASLLFEVCKDDLEVHSIYDHIEKIRKSKFKEGIKKSCQEVVSNESSPNFINLGKLSGSECSAFSSLFLPYLDQIKDIDDVQNQVS
ncbi:hypothetical protein WA158_005538 [Blastocystis sp. Blastoise]